MTNVLQSVALVIDPDGASGLVPSLQPVVNRNVNDSTNRSNTIKRINFMTNPLALSRSFLRANVKNTIYAPSPKIRLKYPFRQQSSSLSRFEVGGYRELRPGLRRTYNMWSISVFVFSLVATWLPGNLATWQLGYLASRANRKLIDKKEKQ